MKWLMGNMNGGMGTLVLLAKIGAITMFASVILGIAELLPPWLDPATPGSPLGPLVSLILVLNYFLIHKSLPIWLNAIVILGLIGVGMVFLFFFAGLFYDSTFPIYIMGIGGALLMIGLIIAPFSLRPASA